jgi:peptide/nickel transport system ATP-binding protein
MGCGPRRVAMIVQSESTRPSAPQAAVAPAPLAVHGLSVSFALRGHRVPVLTDVSFELRAGEMLGIIGESGCGKSTLALAVMGILPATGHIDAGRVELLGRNLQEVSDREMNRIRGSTIAMIFQEPMTSLDPAFTIGEQIAEVYRAHVRTTQKVARERAIEMLDLVGIPEPRRRAEHYPHQFSGGMCQRALIAMALVCEPSVLLADEPTTALDVTTQAQILELLKDLAKRFHMATALVTHDLSVAAELCDRVVVMYAGQVVERGTLLQVFCQPRHPYTERLLACTELSRHGLGGIPGEVPRPGAYPSGCRFHPRCLHTRPGCLGEPIALEPGGADGQLVRCARNAELELQGICK